MAVRDIERKRNYHKGSRHDIIEAILEFGFIPYECVPYMFSGISRGTQIKYRDVFDMMCRDRILEKKKNLGYRAYSLAPFKNEEIDDILPVLKKEYSYELFENYKEYGRKQLEKFLIERQRKDIRQIAKPYYKICAAAFFYQVSSVKLTRYEKPPFQSGIARDTYYMADEIKEGQLRNPITASHVMGVLFYGKKMYQVYSVKKEKHWFEEVSNTEKLAAIAISSDVNRYGYSVKDQDFHSLLLFGDAAYLGDILFSEDERDCAVRENYLGIFPYNATYFLPRSREGQIHMGIMRDEYWEAKVIRMCLPENIRKEERKGLYHGSDEKHRYLCMLVPDLGMTSRFFMTAAYDQDREYIVYLFRYQYDILTSGSRPFPENIKFKVINLEKVTEKLRKTQNE